LNISREHLQDSALIQRISNIMTKRVVKWLDEESKKDPAKYKQFWLEFNQFVREGVYADPAFKEDVAKLLRFESSNLGDGELTSLEEYVSRMPADQDKIYYICIPR